MATGCNIEFVRQAVPTKEHIGMVIPANARMLPEIRQAISERSPGFDPPQPSEPPTGFSFHYVESPISEDLLVDEAIIDNGIYEFNVREAVLGIFDMPAFQNDEFSWSFSSTSQLAVLAAIKIGETLDVRFDTQFDRVFHVSKYHFPPPFAESGYGTFPIHVTIDSLTKNGFRIVSSYEPGSSTTDSRLPFLFGFRVYGRFSGDQEFPIWRELLAQAVRHLQSSRWDLGLLHTGFALEAFIDGLISKSLSSADMGDQYTDHVLRVAERRYELHALNSQGIDLSNSQVNKISEKLNKLIFSPRNSLAHGKILASQISQEMALDAIKATTEFMWDWDSLSRRCLIPRMKIIRFEDLIDGDFLRSCGIDNPSAA